MKNKKNLSLKSMFILITFLFSNLSYAQIQYNQTYKTTNITPKTTPILLPNQDHSSLRQEDSDNKTQPFRYGSQININFNLSNSGTITKLDNGDQIWTLTLESKNATSLSLIYDNFILAPGTELMIYNKNRTYKRGAFTYKNNKPSYKMATSPVPGDTIIIELYEPKHTIGLSKLTISQVIHGYKNIFFQNNTQPNKLTNNLDASGSCNINVNCDEGIGWENDRDSVVVIAISGALCTGTLVNTTLNNEEQYLLTAHHCMPSFTAMLDTAQFYFNWQASTCDDTTTPDYNSIVGSEMINYHSETDAVLLKLTTDIPSSYNPAFSGWSRDTSAIESTVGIHHPSGDIKKISVDTNPPTTSESNYNYIGLDLITDSSWEVVWEEGTTEAGSSGSALFNNNHQIIGQLSGGSASCYYQDGYDIYGKFSLSWALGFDEFLDPLDLDLTSINNNQTITSSYDFSLDSTITTTDLDILIDVLLDEDKKDLFIANKSDFDSLTVTDAIILANLIEQ